MFTQTAKPVSTTDTDFWIDRVDASSSKPLFAMLDNG
jgi:hypothetical protein